jgi:predicted DNA-binding transcriptional regulator
VFDVARRFRSSHSRVRTVARGAGISEYKARKAIRELERRGLLSHQRRYTWHGRGANAYQIGPVRRG